MNDPGAYSFDLAMCNICDCDGPKFMTLTEPVARKAHECCECGSTIDPGERYSRIAGKWANGFNTYTMCEFCAQAHNEARNLLGLMSDEYIPLGELWKCLGQDADEVKP